MFNDGKISIKYKPRGEKLTHKRAFGISDLTEENIWRGRYDPRKNAVSIIRPYQERGRSIPEILKREIYKAFGETVVLVQRGV
jgi:hypothetical protein